MARGRRRSLGRPNLPWRLDGKPPTAMWVRTRVEGLLPTFLGRLLRGRRGARQHLPEGCPLSAGQILDQVSQLDFVAFAVGLVSLWRLL